MRSTRQTKMSKPGWQKSPKGKGPDVVIIAAGFRPWFLRPSMLYAVGRIVVFSPFDKNPVVEIDAGRLFRDEISIVGTYSLTPYEMKEAIEIVEKRQNQYEGHDHSYLAAVPYS